MRVGVMIKRKILSWPWGRKVRMKMWLMNNYETNSNIVNPKKKQTK